MTSRNNRLGAGLSLPGHSSRTPTTDRDQMQAEGWTSWQHSLQYSSWHSSVVPVDEVLLHLGAGVTSLACDSFSENCEGASHNTAQELVKMN